MPRARVFLEKAKSLKKVSILRFFYECLLLIYFLCKTRSFRFIRQYPPGHYYSPLPDFRDISQRPQERFGVLRHEETECFALPERDVNERVGIKLQEKAQLELLEQFSRYYSDLPYPETPGTTMHYHYQNDFFRYADAIILYSIMRHYKPCRIIEVGSGYSSAAMLDVNAQFLDNKVHFTFIEPYPERLYRLLTQDEEHSVLVRQVQDVPLEVFRALSANDILFIDSSHVVKSGSDVAYILFNALPLLRPGVILHFHDIFWPFEYPKRWFHEGTAWNEAYFLRAFLQYNETFEVLYFNSYIASQHAGLLQEKMPLCMKDSGGSMWLRKTS